MTVHDDRLHAEVDRQLEEIRAACDGLATRSGLLIAATSVGATIVAARIGMNHHEVLLVLTLAALGIATLAGAATLMPSLKVGPLVASLAGWMSRAPSPGTSSLLYDSKIVILAANINRWLVMRVLFAVQAISTLAAVGLALGYSAWR